MDDNVSTAPLADALSGGKVPMISPEGEFYGVPHESASDALAHGYKSAAVMTSDTGELHAVPHESVQDALAHNWKLGQDTPQFDQEAQPGIVSRALSFLGKGLLNGETVANTVTNNPDIVGSGSPSRAGSGLSFLSRQVRGVSEPPKPAPTDLREVANAPSPVPPAPFAVPSSGLGQKSTIAPQLDSNAPTDAAVRSFAGNTAVDAAKTGADMYTSPIGAATFGLGPAGELPGTVGRLARVLNKGAALTFAGQGAAQSYEAAKGEGPYEGASPAERIQGGLQGASQVAFGGANAEGTTDAAKDAGQLAKSGGELAARKVGNQLDRVQGINTPEKASPEAAATMAFRPRNSKYKWQSEIQSALPDIRRAADNAGTDVNNVTLQDAAQLANKAKRDVWTEYEQNHLAPNESAAVSTDPVAQTIRGTMSQRTLEQNPQLAERIENVAKTYDNRQLSLGEIEDRVQELNRETRAIEARHPADKRAAQDDPNNAYTFAERNALKNLLVSKMEELSGPGAQELRNRYGALNSVEDVIQRRIPVAERQAPESLHKVLARAYGLGKIAKGVFTFNPADMLEGGVALLAQRHSAKLNDPDYLTQQALKNTTARPASVRRYQGDYLNDQDLPQGTPQGKLPPGRYEQPASNLPSPKQLTPGVIDPEYIHPPSPVTRIRGLLRKGQYEAGPSTAPPTSNRALPPITLPERTASRSNFVEPVGLPETAEGSALQNHFNQHGEPSVVPGFLKRAKHAQVAPETPVEPQQPSQVGESVSEQVPAPQRPAKSRQLASREALSGTEGAPTSVLTPSGQMQGKFKLVEAAGLTPSHDAMTFAKNPNYPEGVQERAYHTSKEAQARVIQQAQNYQPQYTVNTNPDAVNGPPVVTPDGTVLGGNSRTMSTQRLYRSGQGDAYKSYLREHAQEFGLTPEAIDSMKEPVLVREIPQPGGVDEARRIGTDLNKSMTGALGVSEKAVSAGKSIKPESLTQVSSMLDDMGEGATMRDLMRDRGKDLIQILGRDGVITDRERPQFVDTATGGLSDEGKNFVERALMGSVVDDPVLMDRAPKSILNKLEGSLGDLAHLGGRQDEYNVMPLVRAALDEHAQIAQRGTNVATYLDQDAMFGPERNPAVDAVVRALAENPKSVKTKLKQFTQDAKYDQPGQASLGLGGPPSAVKAFNDAFGTDFKPEEYASALTEALKDYAYSDDGGTIPASGEANGSPPKTTGTDEGVRAISRSAAEGESPSGIRSGESSQANERPQSAEGQEPASRRTAPFKNDSVGQEGEQSPPFADPESSTTYGTKNRLVSPEEASAARKSLQNKMFRSNAGFDPTMIGDAAKLGTYHLEAGLREFGDWSKQMVKELGETVRPHLQAIWDKVNGEAPNAPTFYSKAEQVANAKVPNNASGDSILATLRNSGVKEDEMRWLGLDDYLRGKGKVSKSDLQQYIRENSLQIKEATRDNRQPVGWNVEDGKLEQDGHDYVLTLPNGRTFRVFKGSGVTEEMARESFRRTLNSNAPNTATKYSQYTLPGEKKNYSELLLTLPQGLLSSGEQTELGSLQTYISSEYREGRRPGDAIRRQNELLKKRANERKFTSSHFDEPNILAHVRMDDRVDAEGKKVLFVEEVQSDWHQKGKKEGYAGQADLSQWKVISRLGEQTTVESPDGQRFTEFAPTAEEAMMKAANRHAVPDAPFKKDWHELAMKRMLREAAEKGYDKLAWVTGEQTADRYDLSKKVSGIAYNPETEKLIALDHDDQKVIDKNVPKEKLADYVGKDAADKLLKEPLTKESDMPFGVGDAHWLMGDGLKVGGKWAENLYDRAIPNFLNKYGKKWGAKVGGTSLLTSGDAGRALDIRQEPTSHNWFVRFDSGAEFGYASRAMAEKVMRESNRGTPVHSIDITPEMKKSVLKEGQPIAKNETQPSELMSA